MPSSCYFAEELCRYRQADQVLAVVSGVQHFAGFFHVLLVRIMRAQHCAGRFP